MKLVVIILAVGICIAIFFLRTVSPVPHINTTNQTQVEQNDHPLSISAMKRMAFQSEIVLDKKVRETDKFVSNVVSYTSEGLKLYALMNVPKGIPPQGGWPVVIVNHGYIPPEKYSTENSYINTSGYFANAGFLVLKPDYRGHDRSNGQAGTLEARIAYGIDVLNLIAGIKNLSVANSENIFMYGHSMGGDVTLRVLEVCGGCVRAATLWAPAVADWPESSLYFSRRSDPDRLAKLQKQLSDFFNEDQYNQVSTIEQVSLVQVPIVIHHGTADESVPFAWGEHLRDVLVSQGKYVEFYDYPGDTHDIPKNWGIALSRDIKLFRDNQKRF